MLLGCSPFVCSISASLLFPRDDTYSHPILMPTDLQTCSRSDFYDAWMIRSYLQLWDLLTPPLFSAQHSVWQGEVNNRFTLVGLFEDYKPGGPAFYDPNTIVVGYQHKPITIDCPLKPTLLVFFDRGSGKPKKILELFISEGVPYNGTGTGVAVIGNYLWVSVSTNEGYKMLLTNKFLRTPLTRHMHGKFVVSQNLLPCRTVNRLTAASLELPRSCLTAWDPDCLDLSGRLLTRHYQMLTSARAASMSQTSSHLSSSLSRWTGRYV